MGWLLHGAAMTAVLALCVSLAATLLGILLCAAQDSPLRALHWPARLFCSLHRNTPLLVMMMLLPPTLATLPASSATITARESRATRSSKPVATNGASVTSRPGGRLVHAPESAK